jgi:uncharacterized protein
MFRGENEGVLRLSIRPDTEDALRIVEQRHVRNTSAAAQLVATACRDGYKRLLLPSIESETRQSAKKQADDAAIQVFARNLREILMAPPLGKKTVLAVDPGLRTGCKVVCLGPTGKLLDHAVLHMSTGAGGTSEKAREVLHELHARYGFEAVGVGNGTGGREAESAIADAGLPSSVSVVSVDESGASIYSASEAAREEFPDLDLTLRGAISIGRRLLDPLAELVKLDPKSIGVGQYQHDVDQKELKQALDDTVVSCVNAVGVDVNTASVQLLSYVSGLGPQLAANIVAFRNANGPFEAREQLRKVPRLGARAFEQCAGFLRIPDAHNALDNSAVHPESYGVVEAMAKDLDCSVRELLMREDLQSAIKPEAYVTESVGLPTLSDILAELARPGRDPRARFETVAFSEQIRSFEDVHAGMVVPGVVTNVTNFGAFVDIGAHQDGLVHISELADRFVTTPSEIVRVRQTVHVLVLDVDAARKRIALSIRRVPPGPRDAQTKG